MPRLIKHDRDDSKNTYIVGLDGGRTAEVIVKRRRLGLQTEGGAITGCPASEEVATFREAVDWITRFLEPDGSPRPDIVVTP